MWKAQLAREQPSLCNFPLTDADKKGYINENQVNQF